MSEPLHVRFPRNPDEPFEAWWMRAWHAGVLGEAAYGQKSRIARIRRGRYVRIPPDWRGKVPYGQPRRRRNRRALRDEYYAALAQRKEPILDADDMALLP